MKTLYIFIKYFHLHFKRYEVFYNFFLLTNQRKSPFIQPARIFKFSKSLQIWFFLAEYGMNEVKYNVFQKWLTDHPLVF